MSASSTRWLARGMALVISLATAPAGACELHTMTLNGFETAHPVSVPVSLATRQAIDNKQISDIPRGTREKKLSALADIEKTLLAFGMVVRNQKAQSPTGFSVYLTESDHWLRFLPTELGWNMQLHKADAERNSVVFIVSDTAMKGLLSNELSVRDAEELGVLVPVGGGASKLHILTLMQDLLTKFHSSHML